MGALIGIVTVLLEYIDRIIILPIMLALCLMILVTYYAFNYAGIIDRGLFAYHIFLTINYNKICKKKGYHMYFSQLDAVYNTLIFQ